MSDKENELGRSPFLREIGALSPSISIENFIPGIEKMYEGKFAGLRVRRRFKDYIGFERKGSFFTVYDLEDPSGKVDHVIGIAHGERIKKFVPRGIDARGYYLLHSGSKAYLETLGEDEQFLRQTYPPEFLCEQWLFFGKGFKGRDTCIFIRSKENIWMELRQAGSLIYKNIPDFARNLYKFYRLTIESIEKQKHGGIVRIGDIRNLVINREGLPKLLDLNTVVMLDSQEPPYKWSALARMTAREVEIIGMMARTKKSYRECYDKVLKKWSVTDNPFFTISR